MTTSRRRRLLSRLFSRRIWFSRGMAIFALTLAFIYFSGQPLLRQLDESFYRLAATYGPASRVSDAVVVLRMDPESRAEWGPQLPRTVLAEVVHRLQEYRVTVVGLVTDLEGQAPGATQAPLQALQALPIEQALGKRDARLAKTYRSHLGVLQAALDSDGLLLEQLRHGGAVAAYSTVDSYGSDPHDIAEAERLPAVVVKDPLRARMPEWLLGNQVPQLGQVALPGPLYREVVALGLYEPLEAPQSLVYQQGDLLVPAFGLRLAAAYLKVRPTRLELIADQGINVAAHTLRTDDRFRAYPTYYREAVSGYGIKALLDGRVKRSALRDKLVLVEGAVGSASVPLPNGLTVTPSEAQAQLVSALLNRDLYVTPYVGRLIQWGGLAVVAFYLWFLLPRLRVNTAFWLTAGVLVAALAGEWLLLVLQRSWVPLAAPMLMLTAGYLTLSGRQLRHYWGFMVEAQRGANEAYRRLGQVQQQQGQLDEAFTSLRHCQANEAVLESLYDLGLAYERKRQYNKASAVFAYIQELDHGYRDTKARGQRMQELQQAAARGMTQGNNAATVIISGDGGIENPHLGRYEVESMLGRGAMGTVYLARDPRIGRQVAIKTIALGAEFEASEVAEAKARFYREAEAAGRLSHPNIVTVYDVGEEEDLAYIAMDYLEGVNLSVYTQPGQLLPVETVLTIGEKVAEALDYAHRHNVIHRDIKPGNIIYEPKSGKVTVTDFGIASLVDSSKTRTGTILGTPSYMSPEQIAGKKVDGRSDIFSLGVTLYQLLSGELPFEADSLAALMFKITNEKHPSLRRLRSELPACAGTVVNKTLQKEREARYETAALLARDLQKCREKG